jgi:MFS family permease
VRHTTTVATCSPEAAARLDTPRDDVVRERPDGPGRYVLDHGPFAAYERKVTLGPPRDGDGHGDGDDGGPVTVTQHFSWRLAPGAWPLAVNPLMARALRAPRPDGRLPWWYPPDRPDRQGATVLGLLASLSIVVGYHGTLLGQSMTFAADEFGSSTTAQGAALSWARVGGFLVLILGAAADRHGRRKLLLVSLLLCIGATVAGAFAPNLAVLASTQAVNRGAWAGASLLLAVVVAEEMPKGARAYAAGLLSMSTALGAGMALWFLPVADAGPRAWRLLYLVPLLFLPIVARYGRMLPESRRYVRPHTDVSLKGHGGRLALLATAAFLLNVFVAPQTQFRNEFLRDERGLSAAAVSLFALATATPAGIGIVVGGKLADTRGRKVVASVSAAAGMALLAASFSLAGAWMWVAATLGGIVVAPLDPIVRVYGPELFPTSLRARAAGLAGMIAMAGSIVGLLSAGVLRDALGSFGRTMGLLALAPLLVAVLVALRFPETAKRELEDINPEDQGGAPPSDFVTDVEADDDASLDTDAGKDADLEA